MTQKNMIGDKYRGKYKGAADWIGSFIESQCVVSTDDNKTPHLDLEKLFQLAEVNHIDVKLHRRTAGHKNAPGRLRMTIGNMLRSRAKKRRGLLNLDGVAVEPAEGFEMLDVAVENIMTGEKIKVEKPSKTDGGTEGQTAATDGGTEGQTAATDGGTEDQGTEGAAETTEGAETQSPVDDGATEEQSGAESKGKRSRGRKAA